MTNAAVKTMIFLRAKLVISFECVCKMLFGGCILHFAGDADGGMILGKRSGKEGF